MQLSSGTGRNSPRGKHAIQIVDMHRHQFQIGPFLGEIIQSALEFADVRPGIAAPLGKDNQRIAVADLARASDRPGFDGP